MLVGSNCYAFWILSEILMLATKDNKINHSYPWTSSRKLPLWSMYNQSLSNSRRARFSLALERIALSLIEAHIRVLVQNVVPGSIKNNLYLNFWALVCVYSLCECADYIFILTLWNIPILQVRKWRLWKIKSQLIPTNT